MTAAQSIWKYKWFDTPNNEDGLKKTFAFGKTTAKLGFLLGVGDVITSDLMQKSDHLQKVLRVGYWVVPLVGMSTAFTVTQLVSQKVFPTMDQKFAFMLGGMSAAGVMGSWFRSGQVAFSGSLLLGGAAFTYQYMRELREMEKNTKREEFFTFIPDNHEFISYERHQSSHWFTNDYDWRRQHKERGGEVQNIG